MRAGTVANPGFPTCSDCEIRRRHEHEHRDQRREEHHLVGKRVEQTAEIGNEISRSREHSVEVIGECRDDERHERSNAGEGRVYEWERCDERRDENPSDRDSVRKVQTQARAFSTSLLTAFNVSKTPSPFVSSSRTTRCGFFSTCCFTGLESRDVLLNAMTDTS